MDKKITNRKITCVLLILAVLCTTVISAATPVYAAKKDVSCTVPWETDQEKVHIRPGNFGGFFVTIELPAEGYQVTNITTSSNNCKAKIAVKGVELKREIDDDYDIISEVFHLAYNQIELYASKEGEYKVNFDVTDSVGQVVRSKSLEVYANKEAGIRSITINGKKLKSSVSTFCTDEKYFLIKVKMEDGYKLTGIKLSNSYDKSVKTIKNGRKFKLDKKNVKYSVKYYVTFSYKDKYTGRLVEKKISIENWQE